jgi:hypothetical protein
MVAMDTSITQLRLIANANVTPIRRNVIRVVNYIGAMTVLDN